MSTKNPPPIFGASLADDLHQAGALLASIYGKAFPSTRPVLLLLAAIWLAVERLRQVMQTSVQADDWRTSEAATEAKAKELGMWPARAGESRANFHTRIHEELKKRRRAS